MRAGSDDPFDIVVEIPPGAAADPWEAAGATWVFTDFGSPRPDWPTRAKQSRWAPVAPPAAVPGFDVEFAGACPRSAAGVSN
jgi:hypothetical protein